MQNSYKSGFLWGRVFQLKWPVLRRKNTNVYLNTYWGSQDGFSEFQSIKKGAAEITPTNIAVYRNHEPSRVSTKTPFIFPIPADTVPQDDWTLVKAVDRRFSKDLGH